MPARRKPTAVLEANGAFAKNPQRAEERANEPESNGPLGPPPEDFLRDTPEWKKHLKAWGELVTMVPEGVLTLADRLHVEMTARQTVICRRMESTAADKSLLVKMLGQMGLNPADRSRIHAQKAKNADKRTPEGWEALAHEAAGRVQ